jgi:hypothetical protein
MKDALAPKERPILMSAPMVRALLDGRKTQTRRVVKPQPDGFWGGVNLEGHVFQGLLIGEDDKPHDHYWGCPYGQPGDQLWVRESWSYGVHALGSKRDEDGPFVYAATHHKQHSLDGKWRPSIFMPRCACRLLLKITNIRVEQLQDISREDAIAEGIERDGHGWKVYVPGEKVSGLPWRSPCTSYESLWRSINGPDSWDANPWVWALTFEVRS